MANLTRRLRIIVIAPRTDIPQRTAFLQKFGSGVSFVDSDASLKEALSGARQRLAVIVGHVENEAFVLRDSDNSVVLQQQLIDVHQAVEDAQSIALLMGCNAACNLAVTGPTQLIDAFDVIQGLSQATEAITPLDFIGQLADKVGSMHIDTDVLGRLRAISAVPRTTSDRAATGARFVVLLPTEPSDPQSSDPQSFVGIALAVVLVLTMVGWLCFFSVGIGPRRGWTIIKEHYAAANHRGEEEIEKLTGAEFALLVLFGPTIQILFVFASLIDLVINAVSLCLALLIYPWICAIDPVALRTVDEIEKRIDPTYSPCFKSGRGISLLGICIATVIFAFTYCASGIMHIPISGSSIGWIGGLILVASFVLAPLLTRRFPRLVVRSFLASRHALKRLVLTLYRLIWLAAWIITNPRSVFRKALWQKSNA
jgi:hypothetical protein